MHLVKGMGGLHSGELQGMYVRISLQIRWDASDDLCNLMFYFDIGIATNVVMRCNEC